MSDRIFFDTNILVYAIEGSNSVKSLRARELVRRVPFVLSTQVLGEFYRAVTSARRAAPLKTEEAIAWVQLWKRQEVAAITVPHVDLALELSTGFRIGYFDALILAAAQICGCKIVYSEDLSSSQKYGQVRVVNPFSL